jgi:hypothetical protein
MIKEYQSILKNDVCDVVPRPREKSYVISKWISKIKHATYEALKSTRQGLWREDSPKKKELIMRRPLCKF